MPNTLAHLGVQAFATKALFRHADLKWVFLGCVIPDIPWIFQRIAQIAVPGVDPYDVRLYAIIQASLLFCLILSMALALFSANPGKVFGILSINSLFHLLLDACETKWANGVHFFAPLSWDMTNYGLFWPESLLVKILTDAGLIYVVIVIWKRAGGQLPSSSLPARWRFSIAAILIAVYIALPPFLFRGPYIANNHFIKTLRDADARTGKYVELDRVRYLKTSTGRLHIFSGEDFFVEGLELEHPGNVSIRGRFTAKNQILASEYYVHDAWARETASLVGLGLVALVWVFAAIQHRQIPNGREFFSPNFPYCETDLHDTISIKALTATKQEWPGAHKGIISIVRHRDLRIRIQGMRSTVMPSTVSMNFRPQYHMVTGRSCAPSAPIRGLSHGRLWLLPHPGEEIRNLPLKCA